MLANEAKSYTYVSQISELFLNYRTLQAPQATVDINNIVLLNLMNFCNELLINFEIVLINYVKGGFTLAQISAEKSSLLDHSDRKKVPFKIVKMVQLRAFFSALIWARVNRAVHKNNLANKNVYYEPEMAGNFIWISLAWPFAA